MRKRTYGARGQRDTWAASLPAWCIQLVKKQDSPHKVYSCPLSMEGQEVLVHFLVASIHLLFCIDLFTRIHWKKAPKTVFRRKEPGCSGPSLASQHLGNPGKRIAASPGPAWNASLKNRKEMENG